MADRFPHGYALLIGVGRSSYEPWSLPVTVQDVQALAGVLTDAALCAFPQENLLLLHDERATRQGILQGLAWLRARAEEDPEVTAFVYYSGHGWMDEATGNYYLLPHDVIPYDVQPTALSAEDFTEALHGLPAQRLLVIIDTCHAEGMATAKDIPSPSLPQGMTPASLPKSVVGQLKQGSGRAVFTSSRGSQRSWVRPDGSLSIYTYHLLEALQGAGNQPGDTLVRVSNLMNHLGRSVPKSARTLCRAEQTPFFDTATEDFPVAVVKGGAGLPAEGWIPPNAPLLLVAYRYLGSLIRRHRGSLLAWLILQTVLTVLYWQTRERYLIPFWAFLGLSILLAVVTVAWYRVVTRWSRQRLGMAIATTAAWSGLVILLIWAVLYARQFPLERFGIAIATFYEGADLHATPRSRQVSQVLHDSLDNTIRNSDLFRDQVAVERIGVVSREQATLDGKRLRAKLVIWGNVLTEEDGVFLNLEALETPSIVEDPDLPQTLPVASRATSLRVKVASGGTLDAEEIGRRLSSLVTSFSLGLFHYANYQYVDASRQFEAAAAEMEDLSELLPAESQEEVNPGLLYYYLGKTYQILGDFEKSRKALDLAAQHNPTDPAIPVDQAYNYRVMEQPKAMETALWEAIRLTKEHYPDEPAAIHSSALAYERLGEYDRALEDYKAIIELDPDFFVAYLGAARVYMHPEGPLDLGAAWDLYQRAIPVAEGDIPKQVWLNLDLGAWHQRNEQYDEAITAYQRAVELNPQVSRPYYYLAQLYRKLGILDAAHLNFRRVLDTAENPHWAHETYGQFLLDIGDHAGAVEQFNKALRYRIYRSALTYTNLARAYAGLGDLEAAVEAFEQALQDPGPDESYIRQWYAYVLQQSDRPLEAIHQLEAALDASTTADGRLMCQLALLYRDTGDLEGARSLYQEALAAEPELPADDLRCVEEAHRDLLDTGPSG